MNPDKLFLEQYKQIWEQRRQHVGHIWAIPIIITGLLGILITLVVNKVINFSLSWSTAFKVVSLIVVFSGFIGLFLRHDFFIRVLGLLLKDLQKEQGPEKNLPQFGDEFKIRYALKLNRLEKIGSWRIGTWWWGLVVLGLLLFSILCLFFDFKSSKETEIKFVSKLQIDLSDKRLENKQLEEITDSKHEGQIIGGCRRPK